MHRLAAAVLLVAACGPAEPVQADRALRPAAGAESAWTMHSISLYLPGDIIEGRVSAPVLADYIREIAEGVSAELDARPTQRGASGAVVVMVRPDRQARAWVVTGEPLDAQVQAGIEKAASSIAPPVVGGPVVFGLLFSAWGGGPFPAGLPMPAPDAWEALARDGRRVMDDAFYEEAWLQP